MKTPAATEITTSAPTKRSFAYPKRIASACADVLARLLAGEVLTAQDTLDNVQTAPQQAIQNACDEQDSFYDFVNQEIHMLFEQLSSRIRAIVEPKPAA